jgi:hypothetical protein
MDSEIAKPIYWPVWAQSDGHRQSLPTPIGHEATEFRAFKLLKTHFAQNPAHLGERNVIGVERTAQGWFPIWA